MSVKKSSGRKPARPGALALAIVVGAGVAGTYVSVQKVEAADEHPVAQGVTGQGAHPTSTPPSTPALAPSVVPFNAKLHSDNIPLPTGGVRSGGCSGSLIAADWIITAGHCFHDVNMVRTGGKPDFTMNVTIGKISDDDPRGHVVQVVDVRQSPVNDLALARLSTPVTDIKPLTLPDRAPKVGDPLSFAGWGALSATDTLQSDHLKHGRFTVKKVHQYELEIDSVDPRTVENSPCPDDSGSPYFIPDGDQNGQIVAVENNGPDCPQPGLETTARVDAVVTWIHKQLDG
ncbi:S1 family peptidase [Amycolatopsis saalfeldensis]|uniref:S1 family peptidase n=1 Tax=Amycolatopsis saalfeldensis TaxID=394193 RepID=UPI001FEA0C45|nr:trypsin-like serine protease [Amycolatopsis saalfeldensis]